MQKRCETFYDDKAIIDSFVFISPSEDNWKFSWIFDQCWKLLSLESIDFSKFRQLYLQYIPMAISIDCEGYFE